MPPKSILRFIAQPSWVELAHNSVRAEWNSCELCVHQSALHEICRHQCSTSVRLIICPSSGVCIRGFLCRVMVSWLWEAFCSAFCHAFIPSARPEVLLYPRDQNGWKKFLVLGICTLGQYNCLVFIRANINGKGLQSHCTSLFEELEGRKQEFFSKADCSVMQLHVRSVCLSFLYIVNTV